MKKLIKKIILIVLIIYAMVTFVRQQQQLNSYKATQNFYEAEIKTEVAHNDDLKKMKNNINSVEYIEEIAREKLGMYLPNERVYIDIAK